MVYSEDSGEFEEDRANSFSQIRAALKILYA